MNSMKFLSTIRNLNSSTVVKVNNATSSDPLGPYNNDLVQLSVLTYNTRQVSVIESELQRKLQKYSPSTLMSSLSKHNQNGKGWLILLKTLTVIVYLLQNGAPEFAYWLKGVTQLIIDPMHQLSSHLKHTVYRDAIKSKVDNIHKYCTNEEELQKLRNSMHLYRLEMHTPGIKRASSNSATDFAKRKVQTVRRSKTMETPRTVSIIDTTNSTNNYRLQPLFENLSEVSLTRPMKQDRIQKPVH